LKTTGMEVPWRASIYKLFVTVEADGGSGLREFTGIRRACQCLLSLGRIMAPEVEAMASHKVVGKCLVEN